MKPICYIFILCIGITANAYAQYTYKITFASEEDVFVNRSLIDAEGNILLVGVIGHTLNSIEALIIKVAPDGTLQSRRMARADTISQFNEITLLDNGHYFVNGSYSAGGDFYSMDRYWVLIFDQDLNIVTERTYGIEEPYLKYGRYNRSMINKHGDVAIVSTNERLINNVQRHDFIMFRFSQQGDSLSSVQYESFPSSMANSFDSIPGTDSLMMLGRGVLNTGQESINFMDLDMNITSSVNLSDISGHYRLTNGNWTGPGEFLMLADRRLNGQYMFSVFRVNTNGQYLQELQLNRQDTIEYFSQGKNLVVASDSLIYVGGIHSYNTITSTPTYSVIYLIDNDLNLLGRKTFGGDANYVLSGIEATPDNGCFAYTMKYNIHRWYYERDVVMWKFLREDFEIITHVEELPGSLPPTKAWPNPARDEINIGLNAFGQGQQLRFRIYDAQGQKYVDKQISVTGNSLQAHISVLPPGLYMYELEGPDGQKQGGKFVKE